MEINIMSSGSAEPGLDFVAAAFQKETGNTVKITYNLGARATKHLENGDFDVVVATSNAIKRMFLPAGLVEEGGTSIGRAGIGIAVRPGVPVPNISSTEALKRAAIDAQSVLITTETSGLYIEEMLKDLGIYEQTEAKITRYSNAPELVNRLLMGSASEIGFLPINAIRSHHKKGLVLVGPLPEEVQFYREFIAVAATKCADKELARAFARFCGGPGKPLLVANGLV